MPCTVHLRKGQQQLGQCPPAQGMLTVHIWGAQSGGQLAAVRCSSLKAQGPRTWGSSQ